MGTPLSREQIVAMIATGLARYDEDVQTTWAQIQIEPEKWRCSPWGDDGGGFWAVAVVDDQVLWYNDIEEGFNRSVFSERGTIGQYGCSQASITDVLDDLERELGLRAWKDLRDHEVPAHLAGPGTIVRRQTTYWELVAAAGPRFRVHFRDKIEVRYVSADFPQVEIASRHPLLAQYEAPLRSLYFSGRPSDPGALAAVLDASILSASDHWRSLGDYSGRVEAALRAGHGLLMEAPEPICVVVAEALASAGVAAGSSGARSDEPAQASIRSGDRSRGMRYRSRMRGLTRRTSSASSMITPPDDVLISTMPWARETRATKSFMSRGGAPFTSATPSL